MIDIISIILLILWACLGIAHYYGSPRCRKCGAKMPFDAYIMDHVCILCPFEVERRMVER